MWFEEQINLLEFRATGGSLCNDELNWHLARGSASCVTFRLNRVTFTYRNPHLGKVDIRNPEELAV